MIARLSLENIHFKAYHGYYSAEKKIGGDYTLSVSLWYDIHSAAKNDDLRLAVNYERVFDLCDSVMQKPQKLIETLAADILSSLKREYPSIQKITIYLKKMNPPILGQVESTSIALTYPEEQIG